MLSRLALPPGFTVRIDYDPDKRPTDATVTVLRGGVPIGEITVPAPRLDHRDDLQDIVDMPTERGVRAMKEA